MYALDNADTPIKDSLVNFYTEDIFCRTLINTSTATTKCEAAMTGSQETQRQETT